MAQTFTKQLLSESTNGKGIKITTTSSTGVTIHTAISGTSSLDQLTLYAYNDTATSVTLTVEFGGTTDPDNVIVQTIPNQAGVFLICDRFLIQNSLTITAFASVANAIMIYGDVNRIV